MIKGNNILFLLGAGCSKEANIPLANEMVERIEDYIEDKWKDYKDLYFYLRSSIQYSEGIFGKFSEQMNVEKLLHIISEIEKREKNIVYPFIGSWNIRLVDVAGARFSNLTNFKELINKKLNEWVKPKDYVNADYYNGFKNFQREVGFSLRIFSLNYDLCFERIIGTESVELGFDPKTYEWHYKNFERDEKPFKLYKLHGSINWYISEDESKRLKMSEHPVENPELIFGTDLKMKSIDPYLYYTYEFRRWSLDEDCKLIITVGYSYSDDHINRIISQALRADSNRMLLSICPCKNEDEEIKNLKMKLQFNSINQIISKNCGAKEFLTGQLNKKNIIKYFKESDEVPFK